MNLVWTVRYRPAAVLEVSGEDAFAFLQGQLSNDLNPRGPGMVTYGLWLDAKGKVDADSFVIERDEGRFLIVSPKCPADQLRARLERFIIADDVVLTDETTKWSCIVFWGEGAAASAELLKTDLPNGRQASMGSAIIGFLSHRWGEGTIEWLFESAEEDAGASPADLVANGFKVLTEAGAEQDRILRGGVSVPDELGPGDLPQEAGIEPIAVSFKKGCFIGQEVMARLRSMGRVRRGLIRVRGEAKPPSVPAELYSGDRKFGELRSAAPLDGGGFVGRAMVTLMDLPDHLAVGAPGNDSPTVVRDDS